MDVKHLLPCHPFGPAILERPSENDPDPPPLTGELRKAAGPRSAPTGRASRSTMSIRVTGILRFFGPFDLAER